MRHACFPFVCEKVVFSIESIEREQLQPLAEEEMRVVLCSNWRRRTTWEVRVWLFKAFEEILVEVVLIVTKLLIAG